MSNDFWIGLAVIGGAYLYFHRKRPAGSSQIYGPSDGGPNGVGLSGDQMGQTYGPFPGATSQGAAGINTNPTGGDSGTLDNSRLYDPYAQSTTDQGNYNGAPPLVPYPAGADVSGGG